MTVGERGTDDKNEKYYDLNDDDVIFLGEREALVSSTIGSYVVQTLDHKGVSAGAYLVPEFSLFTHPSHTLPLHSNGEI